MTQTELEQLSEQVALKRGISAWPHCKTWLHQDSAFCFELMVSEKIETKFRTDVWAFINQSNYIFKNEKYADHNNDANQATRVAILKAYLAKGE